jgi:hypothetical protein
MALVIIVFDEVPNKCEGGSVSQNSFGSPLMNKKTSEHSARNGVVRGSIISWNAIVWASRLAIIYSAIAFLWSFIGFTSPSTPVHLHEYSLPLFAREVGGHVVFGVVAALVTLNPSLIALAGAESILIDSDHILAALNFPVIGRTAHSFSFAFDSALLLSYLARGERRLNRGVFFVTLSAIASHLSYDVFAGNGLFPLLTPFTFTSYNFPYWWWPGFELSAVLLSLLCVLPRPFRFLG